MSGLSRGPWGSSATVAAPQFGLLEIVGSELRVYLSMRAAGLVGDNGVGLVAHLDPLSDLVVDVASALENA